MDIDVKNRLITNDQNDSVYMFLMDSLKKCKAFYFSVAFISYGGLQLFLNLLNDLNKRGVPGKIITSTYLNFTDPKAIKKLLNFENIETKVFITDEEKGFHSKVYIFEFDDHYKILIGSSNLTVSALKTNVEWNVQTISKMNDHFFMSVRDGFEHLWNDSSNVTSDFLQQYESFVNELKTFNKTEKTFFTKKTITPNSMQFEAINNLNKIRANGQKRALVIAATGTGKTYMSAFDVQQLNPHKVLFIVHREEILRSAERSFRNVLGNDIKTGFFIGGNKDFDAKYIFSTIQTLHRHATLFEPDEFDYIIIDEAHHIGGDTYQNVLNYFQPKFLLGMTATPERCDNYDVFDSFDNNVAIDIRLHDALEENLVVPFHYFGISDLPEIDLADVNLDDVGEVAKRLKLNQRVDYIIEQMELFGYDGDKRKCLGFCVNIDHAEFMANEFNKRGITSISLSSKNDPSSRQEIIKRLEDPNDPLEVIFSVDIFNEGVDIPSVNLVLMLRPTASPIIFVQQLGRGLRKAEEKEYLTVLDFIGNHNRSFLIAIALKGSKYYDKDSLKVSVKNDFADIPGKTFINLDEISKERILRQLDTENFSSMKYLREQYLSFKEYLKGKTPEFLMDYYNNEGSPDPLNFFAKASNYLEFLSKVEKNDKYQFLLFDDNFTKQLNYLSSFLPIRRPHEFALLLEVIENGEISKDRSQIILEKYVPNIQMSEVEHCVNNLLFQYYDSSQKSRWEPMVQFDDTNQMIQLTENSLSVLNSSRKKKYLLDTLYYGISRYRKEFDFINYGNPFFKKYASYTMQEVALASYYEKTHSSFRGSGLLSNGNEYFIFVDLHKEKDIKDSINYQDKLIDHHLFQWQTPNSTSQDSERGKNIIKNKERNVNLHLFVRKFKEIDGVSQPYIYLGKANSVNYHGNKPITVQMELETSVPNNLFDELTNVVEIKNDAKN